MRTIFGSLRSTTTELNPHITILLYPARLLFANCLVLSRCGWWLLPDLNWGHKALQASALPTELKSRAVTLYILLELPLVGKLLLIQSRADIPDCINQFNREQHRRLLTWLGTDTLDRVKCTQVQGPRS